MRSKIAILLGLAWFLALAPTAQAELQSLINVQDLPTEDVQLVLEHIADIYWDLFGTNIIDLDLTSLPYNDYAVDTSSGQTTFIRKTATAVFVYYREPPPADSVPIEKLILALGRPFPLRTQTVKIARHLCGTTLGRENTHALPATNNLIQIAPISLRYLGSGCRKRGQVITQEKVVEHLDLALE